MPQDILERVKPGACGSAERYIPRIEAAEPVVDIRGHNSRMDNSDSVPGSITARNFVGDFSAAAVAAFANRDEPAKTRLVRALARWAEAGAFLKSESCVRNGILRTTGNCTEWLDSEGRDLSGMKDATFSTFLSVGLLRSYDLALSDHDPTGLAQEHRAIAEWRQAVAKRLKGPTEVYFGLNMGWYWPAIEHDVASGRTSAARKKLTALARGIDRFISDDGSIRDRTTRGDRALWYHHTALGEVIVSMEMMRANSVAVPASLERKLHAAVRLFLDATQDYSVLDPWARQRHNARYNGTQDWNRNRWPDTDFAGSWFHVYTTRYAGTDLATRLRAAVGPNARSAVRDTDLGVGIGCLYNSAGSR